MLYNNDWCKLEYLKGTINIKLEVSEDDVLRVIKTPIEKIKKNSVLSASKIVGDNPVICLSGGIDSQALLYMWHEQNIPYTAVTFEFNNGFNSQELSDAHRYANFLNIPLKVIKLDILRFLLHDLKEFSKKYNMVSPQFSVHAYFLDTIKDLGYTGAVFGGNGLVPTDSNLSFYLTDAQLLDIEKYSVESNFPVIPSFLNFDKDLCLALALASPILEYDNNPTDLMSKKKYDPDTRSVVPNLTISSDDRYKSKIQSYKSLNCQIIPQDAKKTGFEEIKNYYNSLNNTYAAFDRDFRMPLRSRILESKIKTTIDTETEKLILKLSKELNS
jgi:hypothetical protein